MEQNSNQQQENIVFKKEDAFQTLSMINTWIGNIDTKISFALALAGVLIGMILVAVFLMRSKGLHKYRNYQN